MIASEYRRALKERKPLVSAMVRFQSPVYASVLAKAGADAITIDDEHYPFTSEDIRNIVTAVHAEKASCIVRTGKKRPDAIYRILDMGADGILIPNVETAEEAGMVVDAVRYPPLGKRGCCPITRGAAFGIGQDPVSYYERKNEETVVGLMIESKKGYENLDEIMAVPGIDFFAIGPSDFSGSFGKPGQAATDPEIRAAMSDAYRRMILKGYSVSGLSYTPEAAEANLAFGKNILNIGSDLQILSREWKSHVEGAKAELLKLGYEYSSHDFASRVRSRKPCLLPYLRIADPAGAELAVLSGADVLVLDDEHFPFTDDDIVAITDAIHFRGGKALVRVHDKSRSFIRKMINLGADGIMAPQVMDYEEALYITESVEVKDGERPITGIMVETKSAAEDIDRILTIPEVDYISVGPSDISASYGKPGRYDDPEIKAVMNMLWDKISASHVALAGQCYSDEKIAPAIADGKTMLNIGSDLQFLIWGSCSLIEKVRKVING
ncbi:MAG: aldolase/citrate lyase family protein [Bullifex sp.]